MQERLQHVGLPGAPDHDLAKQSRIQRTRIGDPGFAIRLCLYAVGHTCRLVSAHQMPTQEELRVSNLASGEGPLLRSALTAVRQIRSNSRLKPSNRCTPTGLILRDMAGSLSATLEVRLSRPEPDAFQMTRGTEGSRLWNILYPSKECIRHFLF